MKSRRIMLNLLRAGLAAGFMGYIIYRVEAQYVFDAVRSVAGRWPWVAVGIVLTFVGLCTGVVRWHRILVAQGFSPSPGAVFNYFFVGQFFNAFMLGACGGDVARAVCISRNEPGRRAEAASTVFVDRAVGLFATILVGCVMILLQIPLFRRYPVNRVPGLLMFVFLAASLVAIAALFRRNLFEQWPLFQRMERDMRFGPLIRRTYEAFYLYRGKPRVLAGALFYSFLNLAFLTLACICFGISLSIRVPAHDYFTLFPIITVIAAIPITPGSLGLREGLFVSMFGTVGVSAEQAMLLSLMVYADGALWSLFGGALFMLRPPVSRDALRHELHSAMDNGPA